MSSIEIEFTQLGERCRKALEYFKLKYPTDSPDGQKWAEEAYNVILIRFVELYGQMSQDEQIRHKLLFEEVAYEHR